MTLTEDELARPLTSLEELQLRRALGVRRSYAGPSVWMERRLLATLDALRATPVADTAAIDAARLREVLRSMWPHHTEGVGSSPPSPTDHSYEVWEPFLPGSPDLIADILAAALRTPKPEGERE